ncbi:MAG TPA: riboflavin synthase [Coriobacteriia bacterium]|nr:riboflavin synthase [Coriobacteriia bacterium]
MSTRMFTGLVESQGVITRIERVSGGLRLEVYAPEFGRDMTIGDSIAVDGACLTVASFIRGAFLADVSSETLSRTTLSELRQGSKVNLERALRLTDRLGGHMVTGHVDAVGTLVGRHVAGNSRIYQFGLARSLMEYVVPKGAVAVDGVSLTVAHLKADGFHAAVVPHTEQITTLGTKSNGAAVNIEVDIVAKYVKRFVQLYAGMDETDEAPPRRGLGDVLRELTEGR